MDRARILALLLVPLAVLAACGDDDEDGNDVETIAEIGGGALSARVTVTYDRLGVPHIVAESDEDAAYALGYVQARARLWQMDLYRRNARGTMGELHAALGDIRDRYFRTVFTTAEPVQLTGGGTSWRIEDAIIEDLRARGETEMLAVAQRYADGVNRYLEDLKAGANGATLDPQYGSLGITAAEIEDWTIQDTFAIGRLQTWNLSSGVDEELLAGQLAALLAGPAPELYADLTRHAGAVPSVILPPDNDPPPAGGDLASARVPAPLSAFARNFAGGLAAIRRAETDGLMRRDGERAGSNNWTVAPEKTAGGHALVADDPHLGLIMPATFHMIHVTTPTRDVTGVAFPGTPVVVIGHNGKVGWGVTVVGYDVTDLYTESLSGLNGDDPVAATEGGEPRGVTKITETISRRGTTPLSLDVWVVEGHGPIAPGTLVRAQGADTATGVSMKWVGQAPTQEALAFYELNAAADVSAAFEAVKNFGVGAQNFVFADTAGKIGYYPHALVPLREHYTSPPWLPLPSNGQNEWTEGFVADDALPQVRPESPPAQGFVATANNDVTGILVDNQPRENNGAWPYLQAYAAVGYRHARIVEVLSENDALTLDDMTALQGDNVSLFGRKVAPWIVSRMTGRQGLSANAQAAVALLDQWEAHGYTTPTGLAGNTNESAESADAAVRAASAASTVFHAWVSQFPSVLLDDELAPYRLTASNVLDASDLPGEQLTRIVSALADGDAATGGPLATGVALCNPTAGQTAENACDDEIAAALEAAIAHVNARLGTATGPDGWRWGRLHRARFANPLQDLLGDARFSIGPLPNDGGLYTVDVANFSIHKGASFQQGSGANVRFTAEMNPANVRWRAVIPGGQDIRPDSPHFRDQLEAWLSNQPGDQPYTAEQVREAAAARIVFDP